ncbi:CYFA0S14e02696g1_1 [Cyberlindnera fabianii]|uniref:CYFA0S14e02696g1_1 n=1 Tax=Cyberlindnera fabianii TaxID=36022 RepID=A0A061B4M1_CYBFA|nr:hypothetical protein BON22_3908 [Cyberlindnera fabianii]CDR44436.1 CYFA0S14e02696g1_1 [Cyberlindnera fabianii]
MVQAKYQCHGTTKAGLRCKIHVSENGGYCHYHVSQGHHTWSHPSTIEEVAHLFTRTTSREHPKFTYSAGIQQQQKKATKDKSGFIYVYTLVHLLEKSPKKKDWLLIKQAGKHHSTRFDPRKETLIKVGLTQGSVQNRLKQWEKQCSHKLCSVDPYALKKKKSRKRSLIALFKGLKIKNDLELKNYKTESEGFYCNGKLYEIEQCIHRWLGAKYGRGDVACHGCKTDSALGHGVHIEWFKVPRADLRAVFLFIDNLVSQYV